MHRTREREPGLRDGIRRLIINTEPMVGRIAKRVHSRMLHGHSEPGDSLMRANMPAEAVLMYRARRDWLGISVVSMRTGEESRAVEALLIYGFSKRSALSFIGHILSQDGMHTGAAMLFYACKRYGNAIRECLAIGEDKMTKQDRRRLGLIYARAGHFGLAGVQFGLSGATKLAEKMRKIGEMQNAGALQSGGIWGV
jgi:hypothetical protein